MADDMTPPALAGRAARKRRPESIQAEQDFLANLAEGNATLLEDGYLGSKVPHRAKCGKGHPCTPRPNDVKQGKSICPVCSLGSRKRRPESFRAEDRFLAALEEQGAILVGSYLGSKSRHQIKCAEGHLCDPKAEHVMAGGNVCRTCSGRDPGAAWQNFRSRVEELGGVVLEPAWKGGGAPHKVRCREGHAGYPYPNRVTQGVGICRTCAGRDPRVAERQLLDRLTEVGATLLDPYQGANRRVRFRCAEGHEFTSTPGHVVRVGTICQICSGRDAASMLDTFRRRVEEQGGTLLTSSWLGSSKPHDVLCREGHLCSPRPSGLPSGKSICRICACRDPHVVEARFRERVAELGGTVLGPWVTIHTAILVRCPEGHEATPNPNGVIRGGGLCRFCKGKVWDVFYVVQDVLNDVIKFGVTSGDPRPRLGDHEREGFDQVLRLHTGLSGDTAPELERTIIAALRDAREMPVRGREYYRGRALALVLDLVDNHPGVRISS